MIVTVQARQGTREDLEQRTYRWVGAVFVLRADQPDLCGWDSHVWWADMPHPNRPVCYDDAIWDGRGDPRHALHGIRL